MADENSDELKRGITLVVTIVIILSFIYGFGREGGPKDTIIPG
ncbi:hypothetical protein [Gorillibacterium sp. sgz5001074]